jgi:hypothetical protein
MLEVFGAILMMVLAVAGLIYVGCNVHEILRGDETLNRRRAYMNRYVARRSFN